ncbi:GntR family transcriptional regulator [Microbacterium sp.]|uniref:GntR family transcriptional regulator n=1 Tax=Microbacterium sp. TaxID=51671 RepID=UPI003F977EDD
MAALPGELESARVARMLREDIVLGRRAPGSRLVERDIATALSVSRLPVREAIRKLAAEGLVHPRPRTWAVVREYTVDDVSDFSEMRSAVETLLFVLAAERHDESGLARLAEILEREQDAADAGDLESAREAAGHFHEQMVVLSGNEVLMELIDVFATRLKWIFGQHEDPTVMAVSHRRLFEAIAARDVPLVTRLVGEHLDAGNEAAMRRFALAEEPPVA